MKLDTKKLAAGVMAGVLAVSLYGCGAKSNDDAANTQTEEPQTQTEIQQTENGDSAETKNENIDVAEIAGVWYLYLDKMDYEQLRESYGSSISQFGASMEIKSDGTLSYYIGGTGGSGTYTIAGNNIAAQMTSDTEGNKYTLSINAQEEDGKIILVMTEYDNTIYWTNEQPAEVSTDSEETHAESTDNASAEEEIDNVYYDVIATYHKAFTEKWDAETVEANGLSYVYSYFDEPIETVGYAMKDIDGDGVEELLICDTTNGMVFEMYTFADGAPKKVLEGWGRNAYYLLDDNTFLNVASNSAANSWNMKFKFNGTALEAVEGVVYDGEADAENPWFMHHSGEWDVTGDGHITQEEALALIAEYESHEVVISTTSFDR